MVDTNPAKKRDYLEVVRELENQVKFFRELQEITRLVNSTLDLDRILAAIVDKLPGIMGVQGCTIRLLQPATNRLELVAATGLSETYLGRGSISREDSIFKVLKGEPVAIYDAASDPRVDYHEAIRREGIKSILAIPIKSGLEVIGVLRLLTAHHRTFTPGEISFAVNVAEEGGNAIEKARTYRKITLLFNQIEEHERFLETILDSLWLELLVVAPDKRVIMANHHFLDSHGLSETEVLGRRYESVSDFPRDATGHCPVDEVLTNHRPVAVLNQLEDEGGTHWYERHLSPILDTAGKVEFVIEAVRDVTDQRLLEKERLARMKLEGVIEMAGTAAHELNSPLFAALGTAQLLQEDLSDPEARKELTMIIRNLRRMGELTKTMTRVTGFESREYIGDTRIVTMKTQEK